MIEIWIVDDEPSICWALRKGIEAEGYHARVFSSAESCLSHIAAGGMLPRVVLLDVRLPGQSGLQLMSQLQQLPSQPAVIIMTAFGDLKVAVDAIRGHAFDYLTKPFDLQKALQTVQRAVGNPAAPKHQADSKLASQMKQDMILGSSPAMQHVYKQIAIAAEGDTTVLIEGEPGTGKSIVASMIHRFSPRAAQPYLLFRPDRDRPQESEAELFGARLSFSQPGASPDAGPSIQPGVLSLAGSGTLVIEEITTLALGAQAKLLSALETGSFRAMMSATSEDFRARLLFTSAQELDQAAQDGELMEAFLAQVRVCSIHLPPLRDRRQDIRSLVQAFLALGSPNRLMHISESAMQQLEHRHWPGNVRELKQVVQRALLDTRGTIIEVEDLPESGPPPPRDDEHSAADANLAQATRQWLDVQSLPRDPSAELPKPSPVGFLHDQCIAIVEEAMIKQLLDESAGNRATVANRLGMHRATLRQKMKRYGLQ